MKLCFPGLSSPSLMSSFAVCISKGVGKCEALCLLRSGLLVLFTMLMFFVGPVSVQIRCSFGVVSVQIRCSFGADSVQFRCSFGAVSLANPLHGGPFLYVNYMHFEK